MIGTPARFTIRALFAALILTTSAAALAVGFPAGAGAFATIAPPPIYSTAPGLPDGRVYEQVSPVNKNGNQGGAGTLQFNDTPGGKRYALAAADGNSVLFEGTGPMGETDSALMLFFVAQRSATGWKTRSVQPRPQQSAIEVEGPLTSKPHYLDPSPDLSHAMVEAGHSYTLAPLPDERCGEQIFLTGPDPFVAATWLERPMIADPVAICSALYGENGFPVGGTPDFSTIYFTYPGTLLPEDASRAPHAQPKNGGGEEVEAWGFYEDSEGALREAGVLPDGGLDPFGAVPAVSGHGRALSGNQVSSDGSRAFFVSPDPASCIGTSDAGENNCAVDPPELYVRENGERTLLVSRDTLLPEAGGGLPARAPDGVLKTSNPTPPPGTFDHAFDGSYVFASPDGSQAFFQSEDRLTGEAPEGLPGNVSPKVYDFDVNTGALTYLPGVVGRIVASSTDGSSVAFLRPAAGGSPAELDLWSAGPAGGVVTPIAQLPGGEAIEPVRMSSDGSVVVFSAGRLPGFNDAGVEIFRYDVLTNTLDCVSCAPAGVPSGSSSMSTLRSTEEQGGIGSSGVVDERGVSADGDRVFFQTQAPLVPQDSNTGTTAKGEYGLEAQGEDVYEWENGVVYLISTGKSPRNSYFLDNSESGGDVFFATTEELVAGDTDGGYSVYDARVPRPGDNPPAAAVPCEGAVCQGPPRVPSPLAAPASATFSGLGNVPPEPSAAPAGKKKITTKTVKCKRGNVKRKNKCVKSKKAKRASRDRGTGR